MNFFSILNQHFFETIAIFFAPDVEERTIWKIAIAVLRPESVHNSFSDQISYSNS
ncbi:MAG: hypothetical protein ACRC6M_06405 [Microcystaceae cyanobacterium]